MEKSVLNKRKTIQYLNSKSEKSIIHVIYKDKSGENDEIFINKSVEQIKEIYKKFNETLKPGESKRFPTHFFKVESVTRYTKM